MPLNDQMYIRGRCNDETTRLGVHTMLNIYPMDGVFYLSQKNKIKCGTLRGADALFIFLFIYSIKPPVKDFKDIKLISSHDQEGET